MYFVYTYFSYDNIVSSKIKCQWMIYWRPVWNAHLIIIHNNHTYKLCRMLGRKFHIKKSFFSYFFSKTHMYWDRMHETAKTPIVQKRAKKWKGWTLIINVWKPNLYRYTHFVFKWRVSSHWLKKCPVALFPMRANVVMSIYSMHSCLF